jgi:hypothetical protein
MAEEEKAQELETVFEMADPGDGSEQVVATKDGKKVICYFDFGSDLDGMIAKFGGGNVFNKARQQMTINLQALMRSAITKNNLDALLEAIPAWTPDAKTSIAADPLQAMMAKFPTMDAQEQANFLARLKDLQAG